MDSCSIDLVLSVKNTSLAHIRCPLSATWPPFSRRPGKGVFVGLYAHLQPISGVLTLKVSRGKKGCPLNHPASPFAKASAVCGRQPHLTRVRKVNNQHPFRRHNFFSSQGFRHSVLSIFTFFETFVCNNEMEINKIEIIDRLNRRLKISSLHLNLNCPSCPIKITHSLLKFAKRPTKKYS